MPGPYSPDRRPRVRHAGALVAGARAEIARRRQVSERIVYRWLQQEPTEGRTTAKPHERGGASRVDAALVRPLPEALPDETLAEQ
jgi:transposase